MESVFLLSAAILGLLAFFEPCTIATHTLFAVRTNNLKSRMSTLLKILISRVLLSVFLLMLALWIFEPPQRSIISTEYILLIMAGVYIVSRYSYIPIPHLDFSRLLPRILKNQHAIQLGLTLPACTIPLFIIVIGMTITVNSQVFALTAGLIYAGMFTLPTVIAIFRGVSSNTRDFLNQAAKLTPFLTAGLFIMVAAILVILKLDLSNESLKVLLLEPSIGGIALGFIVGLIFSFNPVSFAAIPVMLAYVTKVHDRKRAMMMGIFFVLGMVFIQVTLGVASALGGEWVKSVMGRFWGVILGPVLIVLGVLWPGWIKINIPWFGIKGKKAVSLSGAFLLGIPFSIAICPFCSPALVVMLTASAGIGSVSYGFLLLLAFALGRGIPVMIGAWSMGWLESLKSLVTFQKYFEVIAAITLVLSGLYLLNEYFFIVIF